ncbi:MAG: class I SAM-dependent methyltransferase, partial [Gammaproteobacteria bacterium]|nr:class I SAM-dependent methyltransferase [Gammaproteobacteria bacterium]
MALNFSEIRLLKSLNELHNGEMLKAVSIGHPDILVTHEQMSSIFGERITNRIKIREDSHAVARSHGREILKAGVFETYAVFELMNMELSVLDYRAWRGSETIANFNNPIAEDFYGMYDLVVDPGSTEHIFNIAQAMKNISQMVKINGYVYHQTPICNVNHGFYNISPTFYRDYYGQNGFEIIRLGGFSGYRDEYGFDVILDELSSHEIIESPPRTG